VLEEFVNKTGVEPNKPGNAKRRWLSWHPIYTPIGVFVGVAIVALSLVVQNPILSPILASVGITIVVTLISSQIAIRSGKETFKEQNAKEARIRAKDEVYAPLSEELMTFIRTCKASEYRESPFPARILLIGDDDANNDYTGQSKRYPAFRLWGAYRRDVRLFDFSVETQRALDAVENASQVYNSSFESFTQKVLHTLTNSLTSAREEILKSDQFKIWKQEKQIPLTAGQQRVVSPNDWYELLVDDNSPQTVANEWISGAVRTQYPRDTIGWLAVGEWDKAAEIVREVYTNSSYASGLPEAWVKGVFLHVDGVYTISNAEIRQALGDVITSAEYANHRILEGISKIRYLYEGGEPIV
jgi:hypothetical protein